MQTETFHSRDIQLPRLNSLPLREAAKIVQAANRFHCDVAVISNGRRANAKSILGMSTLSLKNSSVMTLEATGDDSPACLEALAQLVQADLAQGLQLEY